MCSYFKCVIFKLKSLVSILSVLEYIENLVCKNSSLYIFDYKIFLSVRRPVKVVIFLTYLKYLEKVEYINIILDILQS